MVSTGCFSTKKKGGGSQRTFFFVNKPPVARGMARAAHNHYLSEVMVALGVEESGALLSGAERGSPQRRVSNELSRLWALSANVNSQIGFSRSEDRLRILPSVGDSLAIMEIIIN